MLVTGASRDIGRAITHHLSDRGWDVFATARLAADLDALDRLPHVHPVPLDVTDRSAVAALPQHLPTTLDAVANNAGIIIQGPVETVPIDDLAMPDTAR